MQLTQNRFKRALAAGRQQLGLWCSILTLDLEFALRCIQLGTTFTAVAMDVAILARGTEKIAQQFRNT